MPMPKAQFQSPINWSFGQKLPNQVVIFLPVGKKWSVYFFILDIWPQNSPQKKLIDRLARLLSPIPPDNRDLGRDNEDIQQRIERNT